MIQSTVAPAHAAEAFATYWATMFPWMKGVKAQADEKIHEVMKKWTAMGPLQFQAVGGRSPLQERAKQLQLPDEFKQKLREKARKRR